MSNLGTSCLTPFPGFQASIETEQEIDAQKIRNRYRDGFASEENIDLSHLGLKHLPCQILLECIHAKKIDLTGNDIYWLPIEINHLGLTLLNISGNKRLQPNFNQFRWLLEMQDLILIANDIGFDFTPRGWGERFKSNQVSIQDEWMSCSTQDLIEDF